MTADEPVNTAVVVGSDIKFSCYPESRANSSSFRWYFYPPSSNQPQVVHTGLTLRPQFAARHDVSTDHTSGRSQLTISGVRLEDAGCYSCYELSASRSATKLAAELVVLGKTCIELIASYPRRLCRSVWVGYSSPSICLFVCMVAAYA